LAKPWQYEFSCAKVSLNETKRVDNSILGDYPDDFIRKMRLTGLISLRGGGRFIDINTKETAAINYILKKENLDLTVFSNKLTIVSDLNGNILSLGCEFPYYDEHCNWCGTSKRNILMSNTNDLYGDISVFIGDGISDSCIVNYADIIFAKKNLASYCWKNNITYFEFSEDIINHNSSV